MIPALVTVYAQLIECPEIRCETQVGSACSATCGLDVREINSFSTSTAMDLDLRNLPHRALSEPFITPLKLRLQDALDLRNSQGDDAPWEALLCPPEQVVAAVTCSCSGTLDAVAFWFSMDFCGEGNDRSLSTGMDGEGGPFFRQAATVFPGRENHFLELGQSVQVQGSLTGSSIAFEVR